MNKSSRKTGIKHKSGNSPLDYKYNKDRDVVVRGQAGY